MLAFAGEQAAVAARGRPGGLSRAPAAARTRAMAGAAAAPSSPREPAAAQPRPRQRAPARIGLRLTGLGAACTPAP
jgi:hypothetical protein